MSTTKLGVGTVIAYHRRDFMIRQVRIRHVRTRRPSIDPIDRSIDRSNRSIRSFFVRSKILEKIDCFETIDSVQKSSKSEPSSRFVGCLNLEFFCKFRFDRFDIPFDSIDIASEGHGGPPWKRSFWIPKRSFRIPKQQFWNPERSFLTRKQVRKQRGTKKIV